MTLSSHPERANREGVRAAVSLGALYDCLGFAAPFGVSPDWP
jgi:hypothetical protein